jgi:hypothetical protein
VLGERRRYRVPHHVRLWEAMQQQHRPSATSPPDEHRPVTHVDETFREPGESHHTEVATPLRRE